MFNNLEREMLKRELERTMARAKEIGLNFELTERPVKTLNHSFYVLDEDEMVAFMLKSLNTPKKCTHD